MYLDWLVCLGDLEHLEKKVRLAHLVLMDSME